MYSKEEIIEAIWNEPYKATRMEWERTSDGWKSRQKLDGTQTNRPDKTTLTKSGSSIWVHYHGGSFVAEQDIFELAMWLNNTNDFVEILNILGEAYHLVPDMSGYSDERRKQAEKRRLNAPYLSVLAKYFIEALRGEKGAKTREYLESRGLAVSERMGAISREIIEDAKKHISKLTDFAGVSYQEISSKVDELFTFGKDEKKYHLNADDYALILPYFNGSRCLGFCHRYTGAGECKGNKYLFTQGLEKGGYCDNLKSNEPVLLVEGLLDAERCKQAGISNVIALGGVAPTASEEKPQGSQIKTLQRYGVKRLIYVPDYEHEKIKNEAGEVVGYGELRVKATENTIKAVLPYLGTSTDGKGFISLRIADLRNNDGHKDADDYIRAYGVAAFRYQLENALTWYEWKLRRAVESIKDADELRAEAVQVYCSIENPVERQLLRDRIIEANGGYLLALKENGFTAAALLQIDKNGAATTYRQRMGEISEEFRKAVENKATAEHLQGIIAKINKIQSKDNAKGIESQINVNREQMEQLICKRPDYVETDWWLYAPTKIGDTYTAKRVRNIGFAPAAVSIIAAPVNHGKTLFLMQTALQLVKKTNKRFIYMSMEEDLQQMYVRALAAYIGEKWGDTESPRGEIRSYVKQHDMPLQLFSADTKQGTDVETETARYWRDIAPRLRFVYDNGADIDTIKNNITAQVEEWQAQGIEVGGIFIDYLQMIHKAGRVLSRTEELKDVCDGLNDLAKITGLPIVVAAQLNRDAVRNDLSLDGVDITNMGESAGIERIANDIYMLWQVDKISESQATKQDKSGSPRLKRCTNEDCTKKESRLYIENLKARDYRTGGYCLLEYKGAAGSIKNISEY